MPRAKEPTVAWSYDYEHGSSQNHYTLGKINNNSLYHLKWSTNSIFQTFLVFFYFCSFLFLGPQPRQVEVPRLRVESELQLLAYATATVVPDGSHLQPTPQLLAALDP